MYKQDTCTLTNGVYLISPFWKICRGLVPIIISNLRYMSSRSGTTKYALLIARGITREKPTSRSSPTRSFDAQRDGPQAEPWKTAKQTGVGVGRAVLLLHDDSQREPTIIKLLRIDALARRVPISLRSLQMGSHLRRCCIQSACAVVVW